MSPSAQSPTAFRGVERMQALDSVQPESHPVALTLGRSLYLSLNLIILSYKVGTPHRAVATNTVKPSEQRPSWGSVNITLPVTHPLCTASSHLSEFSVEERRKARNMVLPGSQPEISPSKESFPVFLTKILSLNSFCLGLFPQGAFTYKISQHLKGSWKDMGLVLFHRRETEAEGSDRPVVTELEGGGAGTWASLLHFPWRCSCRLQGEMKLRLLQAVRSLSRDSGSVSGPV